MPARNIFLASGFALFLTSQAFAGEAPAGLLRGEAISKQWCAACHAVPGAEQNTMSDGAPSFGEIASEPRITDSWLRGWLINPHGNMPNLSLTRDEIEDVITYLRRSTGR
jgi:mono/diheme cytochrome c family protein